MVLNQALYKTVLQTVIEYFVGVIDESNKAQLIKRMS